MDQKSAVDICRGQLHIVLSFFPRVDTKLSVVLAMDTGILGYLAAHFPRFLSLKLWEMFPPAVAIAFIGVSFWSLYRGAFPDLDGGNSSFVFFAEIAKRTESKFIEGFLSQQDFDYAKELLGQVWRNSQILTQKFRHLKRAFVWMALSIIPWVVALIDFATRTRPPQ